MIYAVVGLHILSCISVTKNQEIAIKHLEASHFVWRRVRIPPLWPCEMYEATEREPILK
jgi:hypothetical protein